MDDPPVGWLVVVRGPGKGKVATLRSRRNVIGRGQQNSVQLGDDDMTISEHRHCAIIYDYKHRQFRIEHVDGSNNTYVGDELVTGRGCVLEPFTHVEIGATILRFVPLCGEAFSWDDEQAR